ncbi:hypothetical protein O6R08_00770 [Cutibacterium equinum]|uniref:Galactosyl transferase GMA12/MNN10 family protein n=1 Tax=Cutibacterium equinum TaxID=3016342 RepID=A0ABY7QYS4_9ACTN|nr:hypothetical protein [Cutibacterium equinum]WCC80131.1 hypothetical protein O6R08_00770 [Cutibacterium equinum]
MILPRVCIVSGADRFTVPSYVNQEIWAREFGYDYRLQSLPDAGDHNYYFLKPSALRHYLPYYDWVFWVDDDVYFTDFTEDRIAGLIAEAEQAERSIILADGVREPNGWWNVVNAGVMLVRNDEHGLRFLNSVLEPLEQLVAEWWDPEIVGKQCGGDQDVVHYALVELGMRDHALIVDHMRLNARPHHYRTLKDGTTVHFAGHPDKALSVIDFSRAMGVSDLLVPKALLDKYGMRRQTVLLPGEERRRRMRLSVHMKGRAMATRLGAKEQVKSAVAKVRDVIA